MTHGSLFSGIGGFELGAQWAGIPTIWNCEIMEFQRKILKKRFNETEQNSDITTMGRPGYVDIVSGGFPCQDISVAGKRKGIKGERSGLWGEMYRIIREVRPKYIIAENSPALTYRGFEQILCDLSKIGYDAEWQCLYGYQFGARHKRERIYVIAYSNKDILGRMVSIFKSISGFQNKNQWSEIWNSFELDTKRMVFKQHKWGNNGQVITSEPLLCGKSNDIPYQLDRLESLGNSVMPIIAHYLFECIKDFEK